MNLPAENDASVHDAVDRVRRFLDAREGHFPIDVLAVVSRTGDRLLASDLRALVEQVDPNLVEGYDPDLTRPIPPAETGGSGA